MFIVLQTNPSQAPKGIEPLKFFKPDNPTGLAPKGNELLSSLAALSTARQGGARHQSML